MLTPLYNEINVSKSPVSTFFPMLSLRCRWRSLMMGLLGWSAMHQDMGFDVSDIAALFKVSRQAVYKNIDRVEAMETELQPLSDKSVQCLVVTDIDIDKAVLSLALDGHSALEGIHRVLTCIYGADATPSIGYTSMLLNRAGAFAAQITRTISLNGISQGANDEIFDDSDYPVFTGVDVESTYIYLMQLMDDRKGTTWQQAMDSLKEIGLNLKAAISDAGSGLLKGIRAAFPEADVQIDVFHVLRDIGRAVYRFKEHILKDIAECYDMETAVKRSKHPERDSVKAKKKKLAKRQAMHASMVEDYDLIECLYSWLHELVSFSGYDYDEVIALAKWVLDEMAAVARHHNWAYKLSEEIWHLNDRLPATLLFLSRLFNGFRQAARQMGLPEEAFRLLYRRLGTSKDSDAYTELTCQALEVIGDARFSAAEKVHDRIVRYIKRASSMVENVNSRLRAYMNIKKHVSNDFYSLVQLHLNTKKYRRSRVESRKGYSPVELLTGQPWPELIDLLEERGFWAEGQLSKVA